MRRFKLVLSILVTAGVATALLPSCGVGYIVRSGYYQAELLARREPIADVLAGGTLSAGEEQRLRLIPEIKRYGLGMGLASTENYDSVSIGWDHTIWNLSACAPLAFEPVTWWFPVVGRVPYLGFFTTESAETRAAPLREQGYDVHLRTAGAYSTLGWFRDPVLPGMLRWSEAQLAETVFHELAHATLWVPGSVDFNESFANFTGESAVRRYLSDTYGPESEELMKLDRENRDYARYEAILHGLYKNLDEVFTDDTLPPEEKLSRKTALYASLESRVLTSDIEDKAPWVASIRRTPWNNARLMQFRSYNSNEEWFQVLLDRNKGDVKAFIEEVGRVTKGERDPFVALARAADPNIVDSVKNP